MVNRKNNKDITNIGMYKKAMTTILLVCSFLELVLFPKVENVVGILVSLGSMWMFFRYVFKIEIIRERPVSFIALFNLFMFMYLPLPMTLLDGNDMSYNLYIPIYTYVLQFIYFTLTIFVFMLARSCIGLRQFNRSMLLRFGYFTSPTARQMWVLCLIGWIFKLALLNKQYGEDAISAAGTLSMFSMFIYTPICILFMPLIGKTTCNKIQKNAVYGYMAFLVVFLISTNSRSQMLSVAIMWGTGYLLTNIYKKDSRIWLSGKKIIFGIVTMLIVTGPVTDMGTAMLIARTERSDLSFNALLERTIEIFQDKEKLNMLKSIADAANEQADAYSNSIDWREKYVSNLFFDRLCNYRVVDATIFHAERAGYGNKGMQEDFITHLQIIFPGPIVSLLFGNIDKEEYYYSQMDKLYQLSVGGMVHSGFRVGGDVGLGLATFGWWYFPLIVLVYTLLFILMDSLVIFRNDTPRFSIFTMMELYFSYFLMFSVAGGLIKHVGFLVWRFFFSTFWRLCVYRLSRVFK